MSYVVISTQAKDLLLSIKTRALTAHNATQGWATDTMLARAREDLRQLEREVRAALRELPR